jgi:hypothetical protein
MTVPVYCVMNLRPVAGSGRVLDSYADQDQGYGGVFGGDGGDIKRLVICKAKRANGLFAFLDVSFLSPSFSFLFSLRLNTK